MGRSAKSLEETRQQLGEKALVLSSDAAKISDFEELVAKVKTSFGQVDLLFVNAGIAKFAPLDQVTEAFYDEITNINTKGAFFTVQKFAPLLRTLARTLAAELLPQQIRVNAVSPGPITTPIYEKLGFPPDAQAGFEAQMRESNPMKRFGRVDEVARAVLFFAFEASYTTGAELPVDGGLTQL